MLQTSKPFGNIVLLGLNGRIPVVDNKSFPNNIPIITCNFSLITKVHTTQHLAWFLRDFTVLNSSELGKIAPFLSLVDLSLASWWCTLCWHLPAEAMRSIQCVHVDIHCQPYPEKRTYSKPTMVFASKTQTPTFILGMVAIMKPIVILAFATRSNATVCETLGCSFETKGLRQLYIPFDGALEKSNKLKFNLLFILNMWLVLVNFDVHHHSTFCSCSVHD